MIAMSEPEDSNFDKLQSFDLTKLYKRAENYFINLTDENGMIITKEAGLENKLKEFLKEYEEYFDVEAIQQNIHYNLIVKEKDLD